jgi:hypothetical protein
MLRVAGIRADSEALCIVNIDSYVPISFSSRSQPIGGARYVRFGNFSTQLLEVQFPPESLLLSGFTLVCAEGAAAEGLFGNGSSIAGLPILALPAAQAFSHNAVPRIDIQSRVAVSCIQDRAEIKLGAAKTFNRRITHGRVEFLLLDDVLVGLRVLDLADEEQHVLNGYIRVRSDSGRELRP